MKNQYMIINEDGSFSVVTGNAIDESLYDGSVYNLEYVRAVIRLTDYKQAE